MARAYGYSARVSALVDRLVQRFAAPRPPGPVRDAALLPEQASSVAPGAPTGPVRRAAVAVVLHDFTDDPRVLLMKRAERVGDPWSGHISLPCGGYQAEDGTLLTTAIRETHEELGIDLTGARVIGQLDALHPRTSGHGIEVTPFIFQVAAALEPVCGPEALAAFWFPIERAGTGAFDGTYRYPGSDATFPSWDYEGHVIWGLTLRILGEILTSH